MSAENEVKCIRCESSNTFLSVANINPDKFGYRCRDCLVSWAKEESK